MTNGPYEPITINKDGTRVVIETMDNETHSRRQVIFQRVRGGWEISICTPGVGTLKLDYGQAAALAYALRAARGDDE